MSVEHHLRCASCGAPLPMDEPAAADIFGQPVCRDCHQEAWELGPPELEEIE